VRIVADVRDHLRREMMTAAFGMEGGEGYVGGGREEFDVIRPRRLRDLSACREDGALVVLTTDD
jgi:hypothetical protein